MMESAWIFPPRYDWSYNDSIAPIIISHLFDFNVIFGMCDFINPG